MLAFRMVPLYGMVDGEVKPQADHLFECPMCYALVAEPEKHHAWHRYQDPAGTKLAEYAENHPGTPIAGALDPRSDEAYERAQTLGKRIT